MHDKTKEIIDGIIEGLKDVQDIEVMYDINGDGGIMIDPITMQPTIAIMVPADKGMRLRYRINIIDVTKLRDGKG